MAVTGLLHFAPNLGICRNQRSCKQFKHSIRRDKSHLSVTHISPLTSDHELLAHNLADPLKRLICPVSYRCNVFICRSLFSGTNATECMNTASTALARTFSSLQDGSPVVNLVTAVGVVVFTLWGLNPLARTSRSLILRTGDSNWGRSTTRYVLRFYMQPILLWAGAMLVCRGLDPIEISTKAGHLIKHRLLTFGRSLSTVLAFAYCLSCAVKRANKYFVETAENSEAGSMGFDLAGKAVYTSVWIAAVSLFMELLGFSTKKWLTAGGLGTVLLTLAGREIFTNFLSSAIIQATRPFVVNEWIQANIEGCEVSGTVEDVGWWSPTIIRGEDREAVYIPNHKFTMNIVRNLSQKSHWRLRARLAVSHLDFDKINTVVADMRKVLAKHPQVEQQKLHRRVFLDNISPENQALEISISCFVKTSHHEEYLCVKEAILLDLLRVVKHHHAQLATPIRTIQKNYTDLDTDSIPISETVLASIGSNHKVNGDDPAKPSQATRPGVEPDTKPQSKSGDKGSNSAQKTKSPNSQQKGKSESITKLHVDQSDQKFYKGS